VLHKLVMKRGQTVQQGTHDRVSTDTLHC